MFVRRMRLLFIPLVAALTLLSAWGDSGSNDDEAPGPGLDKKC